MLADLLLCLIRHRIVDLGYEVLRVGLTSNLGCVDIVHCILRLLMRLHHVIAGGTDDLSLLLPHIGSPT